MSVIDEPQVAAAEPVPDPDAVRKKRLRRRRQVLVSPILLVALVLLAPAVWGAVLGYREVTEHDAFDDLSGSAVGFEKLPIPGEQYSFGLTYESMPDVTVRSARVILSDGSTAAATAVSVCRARVDADGNVVAVGGAVGDLSESCTEVLPVAGQDLGAFGPRDNLVVTVVPIAEGRARVTGVELTYEQGGREQVQRIGTDFRLGISS